jgi:hypothetical protein
MTKLLLNTDLTPLYTKDGVPVPSGWIVTDDEMDEGYNPEILVEVKPADIPDDATNLSEAASAKPKAAAKK